MSLNEVIEALRRGDFMRPLGGLNSDEMKARFDWLFMLRTDALRDWPDMDDWLDAAIEINDPDAFPLLTTLLERYVLSLDTRTNPALLLSFWERAITAASLPRHLIDQWTTLLQTLAPTVLQAQEDIAQIDAQEQAFAGMLTALARVAENHMLNLNWAVETLHRIAARRTRRDDRATVRVVFAWNWGRNVPPGARAAFVAEFELTSQQGARPGPLVAPIELFDQQFLDAAQRAARTVGNANFHQLELVFAGIEQAGLVASAGLLTGSSGGLAIVVAQFLANRQDRDRWAARTLPPWLALSATLDEFGQICPVEALAAKIGLLREEGVRVVGVAQERQQVEEAYTAANGMYVVGCQGLPLTVANTLLDLGVTWPVNLKRYKMRRGLSRRQTIFLTACFVFAVLLVIIIYERRALLDAENAGQKQYELRVKAEQSNTLATAAIRDLIEQAKVIDRFQGSVTDGRRVIDRARAHLNELAAAAERDPIRIAEAAEQYRQCGRLAFTLDEFSRAAADYDDALRLADQAVGVERTTANRLLLAKILRERGVTRAVQNKVSQALPDWKRAGEILRPLAPNNPDARFTLSQLHMILGNVASTPAAKWAEFGEAERLIEDLLKAEPTSREYRFTLAEILNNKLLLGKLFFLTDDDPEWRVGVCRRAVDIRKVLVAEQPDSSVQRAYLAASLNHLGNAMQLLNPVPVAEALVAYDEAIQIYHSLVVAFPEVKSNKEELKWAVANRDRLMMKHPE